MVTAADLKSRAKVQGISLLSPEIRYAGQPVAARAERRLDRHAFVRVLHVAIAAESAHQRRRGDNGDEHDNNAVIAKIGDGGKVCIFTQASVDLVDRKSVE